MAETRDVCAKDVSSGDEIKLADGAKGKVFQAGPDPRDDNKIGLGVETERGIRQVTLDPDENVKVYSGD